MKDKNIHAVLFFGQTVNILLYRQL